MSPLYEKQKKELVYTILLQTTRLFRRVHGQAASNGILIDQWNPCGRISRSVSMAHRTLRARGKGFMKTTIMVTDVFVRFRMVAIVPSSRPPQSWEQFVMSIQQVADILVSLDFLDSEAAALLAGASITITPQPGITTVPMTDLVTLTELVYPDSEPVSLEAQQGHALIVHGETTDEALASVGFVLKLDAPLQ